MEELTEDQDTSDYLGVKTEMVLTDDPIHKTEHLTIEEMKHQIEEKKRLIKAMNEEVTVMENKVSQEIEDPINPNKINPETENPVLNDQTTDSFLNPDYPIHKGSEDNPVTLSSDEEHENVNIVDVKDEVIKNCWEGKCRYEEDLTDANPSNCEINSPPKVASSSHRDSDSDISSKFTSSQDKQTRNNKEPSLPDKDSGSSDTENSQSLLGSPNRISKTTEKSTLNEEFSEVKTKTNSVKNQTTSTINVSKSSDSSTDSDDALYQKQLLKNLTPKPKMKQKTVMTKTKNKDGSHSVSAHVVLSKPPPPLSQNASVESSPQSSSSKNKTQDSGIFSSNSTLDSNTTENFPRSDETSLDKSRKQSNQSRLQDSLQPLISNIINNVAQSQAQNENSPKSTDVFQNQNLLSTILSQTISSLLSHQQTDGSIFSASISPVSSQANVLEKLTSGISSVFSKIKDPAVAKRKRNEVIDAVERFFDDPAIDPQAGTSNSKRMRTQEPISKNSKNTDEIIEISEVDDNSDEDMSAYKFDSSYTYLKDLKSDLNKQDFSRASSGLRGLVPESIVSDEDFTQLPHWQIPGLPFDFGDGLNLKETTAMLANDTSENNLRLPPEAFTLKEVNEYLDSKNRNTPRHKPSSMLSDKMSKDLGPEFYRHYQWVNPTVRVLGPKDLHTYLDTNEALFMEPNVAPWVCTLFPKDPTDVKYLSVFSNGVEFVARTVCDRQKGIEFYQPNSEIYQCVICQDIISTPYHVFVNCYVNKKGASFARIQNYKKTFLKACYIHWKIMGVSLPDRNVFTDARTPSTRGTRGNWRGRGFSRRGSHVRSLFD